MNPRMGWTLAALALITGYMAYGWQGVILAFTVIVFWLLLQFGRALRTMRMAAGRPVGRVKNAVMFHAHLKPGLRLIDVIPKTRSLGERVGAADIEPEVWRWRDAGGDAVDLTFEQGRLVHWNLVRAAAEEAAASPHGAAPAQALTPATAPTPEA